LIWNLIVNDILTNSKKNKQSLLTSELLRQFEELVSGPSLHLPWTDVLPLLKEVAVRVGRRHVQWLATHQVPLPEGSSVAEGVVEGIQEMISTQLEVDLAMGWDMLEALIMPTASEIVKNWSSYDREVIVTALRMWTYVLTHSGPTAGKHGQAFTPVMFHCLEVHERSEYGRLVDKESAARLGGWEMLSAVLSAVGAMAQFGYNHYERPATWALFADNHPKGNFYAKISSQM